MNVEVVGPGAQEALPVAVDSIHVGDHGDVPARGAELDLLLRRERAVLLERPTPHAARRSKNPRPPSRDDAHAERAHPGAVCGATKNGRHCAPLVQSAPLAQSSFVTHDVVHASPTHLKGAQSVRAPFRSTTV
jgi:hypothetical protein